jgi:hypothetical protein
MFNISLGFVILFTILGTISTFVIYNCSTRLLKRNAVLTTLAMTSAVLIIEISIHVASPKLAFAGPQGLVIGMFVLYEYIPTLYELCGDEDGHHLSLISCIEWCFAIMGLVIAVFSLFYGLTLLGDLEEMANVIDGYGMLFVIPTVGLGEMIVKCSQRRGAEPTCGIVCLFVLIIPFLILFWIHLEFWTMFAYLTTAIDFFSDVFFGVRRGTLQFKDDDDDDDTHAHAHDTHVDHSIAINRGQSNNNEHGNVDDNDDNNDKPGHVDEEQGGSILNKVGRAPKLKKSTNNEAALPTASAAANKSSQKKKKKRKKKKKQRRADDNEYDEYDDADGDGDDIIRCVTTITKDRKGEKTVTDSFHKDGNITRTVVIDERKRGKKEK